MREAQLHPSSAELYPGSVRDSGEPPQLWLIKCWRASCSKGWPVLYEDGFCRRSISISGAGSLPVANAKAYGRRK
jgi:hypothetical protein